MFMIINPYRSSCPEVFCKNGVLKARIHCEIFLSDYFMKHSLMHISLHLIWFHETQIKYAKRKPPRTMIGKNEYKTESSVKFTTDRAHIF